MAGDVKLDDSTPINTREKEIVKTNNDVLPRKRIVIAEVCRETDFKDDTKME